MSIVKDRHSEEIEVVDEYAKFDFFVNKYILKGTLLRFYHFYRAWLSTIFAKYYAKQHLKFPIAIEIETVNKCNNTCSFCPVNIHNDTRNFTQMNDQLIHKIADELQAVNYKGLLALFSNNEPLIDKRLAFFCKVFREKLPAAHIYLYTNGLLLNYDSYIRLFEFGLDELVIDNYDDGLKLIDPVRKTMEEIKVSSHKSINIFKGKTKILLRKINEILTNRAGLSPNKDTEHFDFYKIYHHHSCVLPFIQLVIRPDGKISKCCQDASGVETLGNINNDSIYDIWNGEGYKILRDNLLKKGRLAEKLCNQCDVSIIYGSLAKKMFFKN